MGCVGLRGLGDDGSEGKGRRGVKPGGVCRVARAWKGRRGSENQFTFNSVHFK